MTSYRKHLIKENSSVKEALNSLNELAADAVLFVVDEQDRLIGSLTDGDIRRGFLRGYDFGTAIRDFIQPDPAYVDRRGYSLEDIRKYKSLNLKIIPITDENRRVIDVLNFRLQRSLLPLDALIMAGGEGSRLRPLTESTPKPLLKIGDKSIIERNIERLRLFGVRNIYISIRYLGQQLKQYIGDGAQRGVQIHYVEEDEPLGTIGAASLVNGLTHETLLVMNSDILTNIDFEDFYQTHIESEAQMSVASVPFKVKVPYAVLETSDNAVISFVEKPTYTYYSSGGIYLINRDMLRVIPRGRKYDATDLMRDVMKQGNTLINYPLLGYWLDIGRPDDFKKAQEDIKHILF